MGFQNWSLRSDELVGERTAVVRAAPRGRQSMIRMLVAALAAVALFAAGCGGDEAADSSVTEAPAEESGGDEAVANSDDATSMSEDVEGDAPDEPAAAATATAEPPRPTEVPEQPTAEEMATEAEPPATEAEPVVAEAEPPATEAEPVVAEAEPVVADLANGAGIFATSCSRCHGEMGEGSRQGRPLAGVALEADFATHVASTLNGKGNMPSFAGQLTPEQINDVVAFSREL